ncbi:MULTISPECIES: vWA domain-containing protein [Pseudoalteromonas]|uniref:vWA domain-containing protein n=1 Tax=Pseudoalteromonas TaxID=53246 RepID=UPI00030D529F|nr:MULTISPECIES: VWA domain-containing protein [Pseudoalteromonas]MCF6146599.1 Ca-activated chloride channel protein [Pseudoalteromonas mariniglutinosa NCIMB 1770]
MFEFHFLRPWTLLLLPVVILLCYIIRKNQQSSKHHTHAIATHLALALTPKQRLFDKLKPIDFTLACAVLLIIACAGPAWFKQTDDNSDKAPLIVLLKVTEAMQVNDVSPTRLTRAKQKVADLLSYRSGAKTALFAYASSSHNVLPFTEDSSVFQPFLVALAPDVMPGNHSVNADNAATAMQQAITLLEKQPYASIVLIADDISQAQVAALNKLQQPFIWWQIATDNGGVINSTDGQLRSDEQGQALIIKPNSNTQSSLQTVTHQALTLDMQDVIAIDNFVEQNYQRQRDNNNTSPYQDMAWYFTWPVLLLSALWFRKGWTSINIEKKPHQTIQTINHIAVLFLAGSLLGFPKTSYASTADWFFTRDQQAMMAYNNLDFARAATLFSDPQWQAKALFEQGKYTQAAEVYGSLGTIDGFYNRATALLKIQEFEAAIAGFKQVLKQQPEHLNAQRNLAIAEHAYAAVIAQAGGVDAEQSITTEVDGNEVSEKQDGNSQDYQVTDSLSPDAKEQWMRSVDSEMGDFLKNKFATEANAQRGQ